MQGQLRLRLQLPRAVLEPLRGGQLRGEREATQPYDLRARADREEVTVYSIKQQHNIDWVFFFCIVEVVC